MLAARGLLGPRTVVAHGATTIREEGRAWPRPAPPWPPPRAAAFWGTQMPPLAELAGAGVAVALGTDGLFRTPPASWWPWRSSTAARPAPRAPPRTWPAAALALAARLAGGSFGRPSACPPGAVADVVILGWRPAVPLPALPLGDLAMLWAGAPAAWAIVAGRVRLREGRLLGVDEAALAARAPPGGGPHLA
ncbi:MAG: hypothetical protein IPO09_12490 [Anaeromyxobacter sp.]|nr:hypothetical protein [Anaeromyxobacter sp.]